MVFTRKPDLKPQPIHSEIHRIPTSPSQLFEQPASVAAAAAEAQSVIGNDLSIEGQSITIRCKGALRINGNIQADLHSRKLIVGPEALITGAIAATDVEVYGRVQGAIYGTHVALHETAQVEGDIHSEHLQIQKGAAFDGRSRKVLDASEIAPKLEPTQAPAGSKPSAANGDATAFPQTFPTPLTGERPRLHA